MPIESDEKIVGWGLGPEIRNSPGRHCKRQHVLLLKATWGHDMARLIRNSGAPMEK